MKDKAVKVESVFYMYQKIMFVVQAVILVSLFVVIARILFFARPANLATSFFSCLVLSKLSPSSWVGIRWLH